MLICIIVARKVLISVEASEAAGAAGITRALSYNVKRKHKALGEPDIERQSNNKNLY